MLLLVLLTYAERHMQVFSTLYCSVMSDHLFPKNNIVLPTNGRAPQLCWGKTIYSLGNFTLYDRSIIFFYFWRWWGGGGYMNIFIFIFYFFLWRCVTHHWGRVWGVNLFQTKWFIFLFFIFFMAVVAPHWGRVAWVKLKNKKIFYFFYFWWWWGGGGYMYFFYFFLFWRWSPLTGGGRRG